MYRHLADLLLLPLGALLLVGCPPPDDSPDAGSTGSDATSTDADIGDAGTDAGDALDVVDDTDAGPTRSCVDAEPVALGEREPVETGDWLTAEAAQDNNQIRPAIRAGEFEVPTHGSTEYGTTWTIETPDETGVFETSTPSGQNLGWAATTVDVDEPTVLVAESHGLFEVFAGGTPYSGDIYGYDYLVPIPLEPGNNRVVFRYTGRTKPRITLTRAPGDIAVDASDATYPTLRAGTDVTLPLGIPVLNLAGRALTDVTAQVVENEHFEATEREFPALGPDSRSQLGFRLEPKSEWTNREEPVTVRLRVSACELDEAYTFEYELNTTAADETFRQTFVSPVDGSVQYYGARPPENYTEGEQHGLVMSLHGAGVDGAGLPTSYSPKEWAWIISPTNRRPFGFNWEEWGHWNALASLNDARDRWAIDNTRVHITGHSMGGHGTWHVGVHNPGEFATLVPSAGWESIYSYPPGRGMQRPSGVLARARAHSDTKVYLDNIQNRSVYVIHGKADENVPTAEGEKMCMKAKETIPEEENVKCHFEPEAEHWWDGDAAEGTDCVDWPGAWEMMKDRRVDPTELEFEYRTPGAWYGPTHSYVKIDSSETPMEDVVVSSTKTSDTEVELTLDNVRSLEIDGAALTEKGIETVAVVQGEGSESHEVPDGTLRIGPESGKTAEQQGPMNQVFRDPFCFVYPEDGAEAYREYTSYLISSWSVRGNGYACAMPYSKLDEETRQNRHIVYVGLSPERADLPEDRPFGWDGTNLSIGDETLTTIAGATVFPEGDDMAAAVYARPDAESVLLHPLFMPFDSRRGMPDYFAITTDSQGNTSIEYGLYDSEWNADADLRQ